MSARLNDHRTSAAQAANAVINGAPVTAELAAQLIDECITFLTALPAKQHPLGFLHLDLAQISGVEGSRLHIWTPTFQAQSDKLGRLHDHSWELHSDVLVGSLIDHVFRPVQAVEGLYKAHQVSYGQTENALIPIDGLWDLEEVETREIHQGNFYRLAPRLIHLTEISLVPTATFLVALERGGPGPTVYTPAQTGDAAAAERPLVPRETVHQSLQEIAAILSLSQ